MSKSLNLKDRIHKEILPKMKEGYKEANIWSLPHLKEVVVNVGLGRVLVSSPKPDDVLKKVSAELSAITGQKPIITKTKKAIASFKTRLDMPIGLKVRLHGEKMYSFLDKFIKIAMPRTRDFRGINESTVDSAGNLNVGIKDHTVFSESTADAAHTFGLEFTAVVKGSNRDKSLAFFKLMGFPFRRNEK